MQHDGEHKFTDGAKTAAAAAATSTESDRGRLQRKYPTTAAQLARFHAVNDELTKVSGDTRQTGRAGRVDAECADAEANRATTDPLLSVPLRCAADSVSRVATAAPTVRSDSQSSAAGGIQSATSQAQQTTNRAELRRAVPAERRAAMQCDTSLAIDRSIRH